MPKPIVILGARSNCIEMLDVIEDINDTHESPVYDCVGYLDDDPQLWGTNVSGAMVLGPLSSAKKYGDCCFINGIGSDTSFWKKPDIIGQTGLSIGQFENVIHPTASVSRRAQLGRGVMVFQHVTVTANARIGNHVFIRPNALVSHDDVIGDYTIITGGVRLAGRVHVGDCCYLGLNCSVRGDTSIGRCSLVGMGCVVISDVPENAIVVGNPARYLRPNLLSKVG